MAAPRFGVIAAILRKDFIGLWPLVLGASLLPICLVAERLVDVPNAMKSLLAAIGALAMGALVVTVFHQDAAPSVRHDWKTRPIDALNLVIAKVAFLTLALGLPIFAAQFARELLQDHSIGEAVLSALVIVSIGMLAVIPVILLALVTSSLVEAFVVMFAYVILSVLATTLLPRPTDTGAGAAWILNDLRFVVAAVFAVAIAVLLFRRKAPGLARLTFFAGIVVCSVGLVYLPGRAAIAVGLQGIGVDAPQARALTTKIANVCAVKDGWRRKSLMQKPEPLLIGEMAVSGQPAGWQVAVDHLRGDYLDQNGKPVHSVWAKAREAGPPSAQGNTFELESIVRAGDDIEKLRWTYALTLLEPVASQDLTADGKRRYVRGFGYCQAQQAGRREIRYRCFKPFGQPAAISTEVVGKPETFNLTSTAISYKPAILEGFGDYRQGAARPEGPGMRSSSPQILRLTAYAPRAHVSRQTTMPLAAGAAPICEKKQ